MDEHKNNYKIDFEPIPFRIIDQLLSIFHNYFWKKYPPNHHSECHHCFKFVMAEDAEKFQGCDPNMRVIRIVLRAQKDTARDIVIKDREGKEVLLITVILEEYYDDYDSVDTDYLPKTHTFGRFEESEIEKLKEWVENILVGENL